MGEGRMHRRQRAVGDRSRAANGALSTYQWRAAACALIIHVITIERTHPGRAPWRIHGVFAVRPGWKPPSDQSRNCRPDKQLKTIPRNGGESAWNPAEIRSLRKRVALSIFACNFEYSHLPPPPPPPSRTSSVPALARGYCDSAV